MPTLHEITADLAALADALADREGDVSDIEAQVDAWLEQLSIDLEHKADNYAVLIREFETRANVRYDEASRLMKLAKTDEGRAGWLKARLKDAFTRLNITKLETPRFRLSVVRNGGKPPLLISPEVELPAEFLRVIPASTVPDTEKLRAALESGRQIAGVKLDERGTRLAIK